MNLIEIRQELELLAHPDSESDPELVLYLRAEWESIRWSIPIAYHPIIDDRLELLERNLNNW